MQTDLIIINDFCDRCHVDPSFIMELEEDGLIEVRVIDEERYLPTSQLAELERYTHLYYDLSINIAGIDAIHHMLERIELLQQEVRSLRNELEFYRNFGLHEKSPNSFLPGLPRSIINQFRFHNLLCLCLASVHLPHPFHLVFGF